MENVLEKFYPFFWRKFKFIVEDDIGEKSVKILREAVLVHRIVSLYHWLPYLEMNLEAMVSSSKSYVSCMYFMMSAAIKDLPDIFESFLTSCSLLTAVTAYVYNKGHHGFLKYSPDILMVFLKENYSKKFESGEIWEDFHQYLIDCNYSDAYNRVEEKTEGDPFASALKELDFVTEIKEMIKSNISVHEHPAVYRHTEEVISRSQSRTPLNLSLNENRAFILKRDAASQTEESMQKGEKRRLENGQILSTKHIELIDLKLSKSIEGFKNQISAIVKTVIRLDDTEIMNATRDAERPPTHEAEKATIPDAEMPSTRYAEEPSTRYAEEPSTRYAEEPQTGDTEKAQGAEGPPTQGAEGPPTQGAEGPPTQGAEGPPTQGAEGPPTQGAEGPETVDPKGLESRDTGSNRISVSLSVDSFVDSKMPRKFDNEQKVSGIRVKTIKSVIDQFVESSYNISHSDEDTSQFEAENPTEENNSCTEVAHQNTGPPSKGNSRRRKRKKKSKKPKQKELSIEDVEKPKTAGKEHTSAMLEATKTDDLTISSLYSDELSLQNMEKSRNAGVSLTIPSKKETLHAVLFFEDKLRSTYKSVKDLLGESINN